MSNHAHLDCEFAAMERSCWEAFIGREQESVLLELLRFREVPDNRAFERDFGLPDVDAGTTFWEGESND